MKVSKFSVGDSVYLKSGGPKMTVTEVIVDDFDSDIVTIRTQWFVGQKVNHTTANQDAFTSNNPNPKKDIAEKK